MLVISSGLQHREVPFNYSLIAVTLGTNEQLGKLKHTLSLQCALLSFGSLLLMIISGKHAKCTQVF
jgi:hypothetical protein